MKSEKLEKKRILITLIWVKILICSDSLKSRRSPPVLYSVLFKCTTLRRCWRSICDRWGSLYSRFIWKRPSWERPLWPRLRATSSRRPCCFCACCSPLSTSLHSGSLWTSCAHCTIDQRWIECLLPTWASSSLQPSSLPIHSPPSPSPPSLPLRHFTSMQRCPDLYRPKE